MKTPTYRWRACDAEHSSGNNGVLSSRYEATISLVNMRARPQSDNQTACRWPSSWLSAVLGGVRAIGIRIARPARPHIVRLRAARVERRTTCKTRRLL
jgi:hypothetical protein